MKKSLITLFSALLMLCSCSDNPYTPSPNPEPVDPTPNPGETVTELKKVPFEKGLNLSDWFNADEEYWFNPDAYGEKDFDQLKSLGVDVVRLPINFPIYMGAAPDYKFSDKFLAALDKAVKYAEDRDMYVILDNHSYYGSRTFPQGYGEALVSAGFRQLAARYKDHGDKVIFELFNEPGGTYLEQNWGEMQQRLITEIRAIDPSHIIIVTPPGCHYYELKNLPNYDDKRLIYTFHFYAPFMFTHQGANWDNIPLEYLSGLPFPYDVSRMPQKPSQFAGTEYDASWSAYPAQGTEKYIGDELMTIYSWATQNNKLLFCGEFGTLTSAPKEDRARWYKAVCDYFSAFGIAWTAWEYRDTKTPNFGIFNGANIFESNLDTDLINAMGFTLPPEYATGCPQVTFYEDEIPSWWSQGGKWDGYEPKVDFACKENPYDGSLNCIRWDVDNIWGGVVMTPWPVADFTRQYNAGANLEFAIRTTAEIDKLVVRFVQYKTGAKWQWRNIVEIATTDGVAKQYQFSADGEWHKLSIPLSAFWIHGTQGDWKESPDADDEGFAWDCVNHLEIVPEGNEKLLGKTIYLDNILIRKN